MLESEDEIGEPDNNVLYDFGSQNKRRIVFWMMNELRDSMFKLDGMSDGKNVGCSTSVGPTSSRGKSAGQVIIGVHVRFVLPSSRRGSGSVVAFHGDGSKRGRAMAIAAGQVKPTQAPRLATRRNQLGTFNFPIGRTSCMSCATLGAYSVLSAQLPTLLCPCRPQQTPFFLQRGQESTKLSLVMR
jgi:hypothetical protein